MTRGAQVEWTDAELALLRERYPQLGAMGMVSLLPGRTLDAVHAKAQRLRLRFKPVRWTPDEDAVLRRLYPLGGSAPVVEAIGRDAKSVCERAKRLGVKCLDTAIGSKVRWSKARSSTGLMPTMVHIRKRRPAAMLAADAPARETAATRRTVAPPPRDRWAVDRAPRIVNPEECRPWARVVAGVRP